jgi:hypothetical protein
MFFDKKHQPAPRSLQDRIAAVRRAVYAAIEDTGTSKRQAGQLLHAIADEYEREAILNTPINPQPVVHSAAPPAKQKFASALSRLIAGNAA